MQSNSFFKVWGMMKFYGLIVLGILLSLTGFSKAKLNGEQPLSKVAIHKATLALDDLAYIKASPAILGLKGGNTEWVNVQFSYRNRSNDDWIGVFSPSNFSAETCLPENPRDEPPLLCSAPIKYQFANYSNPNYKLTGSGSLKLQLINQRADFSIALFSGGISNELYRRGVKIVHDGPSHCRGLCMHQPQSCQWSKCREEKCAALAALAVVCIGCPILCSQL